MAPGGAPAPQRLIILEAMPQPRAPHVAWLAHPLAFLGVLLVALWISLEGHGGQVLETLPGLARATLATVALFGLTGYPLARTLTPRAVMPHFWLLVLPVGAAGSTLALTILGFVLVPLPVALAMTLAAGAAGALWVRARDLVRASEASLHDPAPVVAACLWPLVIAAVVAGLTLMPSYRTGALVVPGTNADAHLVTGAAEILRAGPPTAIQPDLPVDRVSPYWQSKYPIYYALAGVAELSGLDPVHVFPVLSAVILALFALGTYVLARSLFRVSVFAATLVMAFTSLDRVVLYVAVHPYYNQLWGLFTLPFILLFGFRFLARSSARDGALALLFGALGAFAYPLMLPFPLVALTVGAFVIWRRHGGLPDRRPPLRGLRRSRARWIVVALALPVLAVATALTSAAIGKVAEIVGFAGPWGGIPVGAQGDRPDLPLARYFGLPDLGALSAVPLLALALTAVAALMRTRPEVRIGLATMAVAALVMGAGFHFRERGEYLEFKIFAFVGPVALALATAALTALARQRQRHPPALGAMAALALIALGTSAVVGARDELEMVHVQTAPEVLELREWAARLPPDASVRLDIPPNTFQLWAAYMLHERPLSALVTIDDTIYPRVFRGKKADYALTLAGQPRPPEAVGAAAMQNAYYRLYRLDPSLPGPDHSTRARRQP